jgi:hypothetical protein
VDQHVSLFRAGLVTAQAPNQPTHREGIAEPCRKLARAQHRGMAASEADRPNVQAGVDFIGERGGWSFR